MNVLARLTVLCLVLVPFTGEAHSPAASPLPPVPTTKILAIGRFVGTPTPEQLKLVARREVPDTVRLYLPRKIDQWWSLQEGNGVVFLMNAYSVEEARGILEPLPLGQAKLMTFELIPLGALRPLSLLLGKAEKSTQ